MSVLPLRDTLRTLDRSGYGGVYDVEILSEDLWVGDPRITVDRCRTYFDAVWES